MVEVFASLGSNEESEKNIRSAVAVLRHQFGELRLSPVYRSKSVGFEGEDFLNMVVAFDASATPEELLQVFHQIEKAHGRERNGDRFGPRSLDIDLILYGDRTSSWPVSLPRNDIVKYAFVLKPLVDLVPDYQHPLVGETYAQLWDKFPGNRELVAVQWDPDAEQ